MSPSTNRTVDLDGSLRLLVGCPCAGEHCCRIGIWTGLTGPIGKSADGRNITPIEAGCSPVNPGSPFGDGILAGGKVCRVTYYRHSLFSLLCRLLLRMSNAKFGFRKASPFKFTWFSPYNETRKNLRW